MDLNLHQKQGVTHLEKVLGYAPFVAEEGKADVHLTTEDWHVLADMLFHMNTPADLLPAPIQNYRLGDDQQTIEITTADLEIVVRML